MQLQQIRYFVAVAEAGTVSSAARTVFVTQPALSRQLRQLEGELGVELFERVGGRLVLSRSGIALLPWAQRVVDSASELLAEAQLLRRGRLERITIAAPWVSLTDIVSPFVAAMDIADPVVDVVLADTTTVAEMLLAGADLAIGTRSGQHHASTIPFPPLPVWAYVRDDDPWAQRVFVGIEELDTRTLVVLPPSFTARVALDSALAANELALGNILEAANGTVAQALAAAGRGVAMVSDDPRFGLVPIAIIDGNVQLSVHLMIGWKPSGGAAPDLERLAHRIAEWVTDRYGAATEACTS